MLGRGKAEAPEAPTVESLSAEIVALDKAVAAEGSARVEAQAELGGTNELGRRAELRERIEKADATIADGMDRLDHLRCQRDRLAMERELGKLDPLRAKIAEGEAEAQDLRARLAAIESTVAAAQVTLADAEDAIRHPHPTLSQESRWVVQQFKLGGGPAVEAAYGQLPRREQRLVRRTIAALNEQLPTEAELVRRAALASWDEAEITPVGFPESERELTSYPLPPERPPQPLTEPPYPKVR